MLYLFVYNTNLSLYLGFLSSMFLYLRSDLPSLIHPASFFARNNHRDLDFGSWQRERRRFVCLNEFVSLSVAYSHTMPIMLYYWLLCSTFALAMAFWMQHDFMAKKINVLRIQKWNKNKTKCIVFNEFCVYRFPNNRLSICYLIIPYPIYYLWCSLVKLHLLKKLILAVIWLFYAYH